MKSPTTANPEAAKRKVRTKRWSCKVIIRRQQVLAHQFEKCYNLNSRAKLSKELLLSWLVQVWNNWEGDLGQLMVV